MSVENVELFTAGKHSRRVFVVAFYALPLLTEIIITTLLTPSGDGVNYTYIFLNALSMNMIFDQIEKLRCVKDK